MSRGDTAGPTDPALTRKVAVIVRARFWTTALDTATGLLLVNLLPKADMAVLSLLLVVYEATKSLAMLGLPEGVLYFFETWGPTRRRAFALRTSALIALAALVAGAAMLGLAGTASAWLPRWSPEAVADVRRYLPLIALLALLELPTWPVTNVLVGLDRPQQAGLYQVLTSVLLLVCLLSPILMGWGLPGAMAGIVAYGLVRFAGSWVWLFLALPRESQAPLPPGALREQLRFSIPLGLSTIVGRLNKYLDKGIVAVLLVEGALAEYDLATREIPFVTAFAYGAATVLIGRYVALRAAGDQEGLRSLWHRGVRAVSLVPLPVAALLIAMAPDLIPTIKEGYEGAIVPFQISTLLVLVRVANFGALVQALGDTRVLLRITLASLATNLVLNIPMTLAFGITGTALATLLATAMMVVLLFRVIGRGLAVPAWQVVPFAPYAATLLLGAVGATVGLIVRHAWLPADQHDLAAVLAVGVPGLLAYLALGTWTGVIRRRDWIALRVLVGLGR